MVTDYLQDNVKNEIIKGLKV